MHYKDVFLAFSNLLLNITKKESERFCIKPLKQRPTIWRLASIERNMFIKSWPSQKPTGLANANYFPHPDCEQKTDYAEKIATSLPFNYFCRNVLNMRKSKFNNSNNVNRMNVASFHDWSEENSKQCPTSKLYQEVATLKSICSFSDPKRHPTNCKWDDHPSANRKLFHPEVTDWTKGEKNIIAGICKNSGCVLPHIDSSFKQGPNTEGKKGVSLKGRKLTRCMPPLLSRTHSMQVRGLSDPTSNHWWERHSESAPPFPLRVKYFRDYKFCSLLDHDRGFLGETRSESISPGSSCGTKAPPNTPDETAEIKSSSRESPEEDKTTKAKHVKASRKEIKLENGKKKTHLIVYLPKTDQQEDEEAEIMSAGVLTKREMAAAIGRTNGGIRGQNKQGKIVNLCLTTGEYTKDEKKK